MQNIQEVFNRMQVSKKEQKKITMAYQNQLSGTPEYQEVVGKIKTLRERKKQIENVTKQTFSKELEKLEQLKLDFGSDAELLSDIALTKIMKGETVEVVDEYNNSYNPLFTVKFKQA